MSDTVTLSRAEYDALLDRIEELEDAAALERLETRIEAEGFDRATRNHLPLELIERLLAGEHPLRVWRKHRGLSREALSARAGVSPSYLTEIETGKKPGSFGAISKLAAALEVPLDDLADWLTRRE